MKLVIHRRGEMLPNASKAALDKLRFTWENKAIGPGALHPIRPFPSSTSIARKEPGCHVAAYALMPRVSKRLRFEILRRDGFKCRYCGTVAAERELRVDHVIPEALGGSSDPSNLATSCDPCNNGKSSAAPDAPIVDEVANDALRWSQAMQRAARWKEEELTKERRLDEKFLDLWRGWEMKDDQRGVPLDDDWSAAVRRLRVAGLTEPMFAEAVTIAMRARGVLPENTFRYFCGVAWNMVAQLQEAARNLLSPTSSEDDEGQYASMTRDDLEEHVWRFEFITEKFLEELPVWLQETAEREAREDWRKADEPNVDRLTILPDVLRHVGHTLARCEIRPAGEDDN